MNRLVVALVLLCCGVVVMCAVILTFYNATATVTAVMVPVRAQTTRVVAILATHTSSALKFAVANSVVARLKEAGIQTVIVVNSTGTEFPLPGEKQCENHPFLVDHRKFYEGLQYVEHDTDVVVMINDSCLVTATLRPFVQMIKRDQGATELYGYVESLEGESHYQSMLRAFNRKGLATFRRLYEARAEHITSVLHLIQEFEVGIGKHFATRKVLYPAEKVRGNRHFEIPRICKALESGYALLKLKAMHLPVDRIADGASPPEDFTPSGYKALYHDLQTLPDADCWAHYMQYGRHELRLYAAHRPRQLLTCVNQFLATHAPDILALVQ